MKLFTVKLSEMERELLEAHRKSFGLRSQAEAVRHLIVYVSPMAHRIRGPLDYVNPGPATASPTRLAMPSTVAKAYIEPFRGVTASGEPLPDRKPYQKTGKK